MTRDRGRSTPKRREPYSFERLEVWHLAEDVIVRVYRLARTLPKFELYGIGGQIRRAAVSVALNIAEGRAADSDAEFRRFLGIAERSLVEVVASIRVCVTLDYTSETGTAELLAACDRLQAKLRTLRKCLGKGMN